MFLARPTRILALLAVAAMPFAPANVTCADDSQISFDRDIRPILSDRCFQCHGPDEKARKAKLRLDTREGMFADLGGYEAVVPGKPEFSELIIRVTSQDKLDRMPPAETKRPLTDEQIALLRKWVEQGAKWQQHWAFVKPQRPELPEVKNENWPRNAIDRFVLARLEKEGSSPSPEARKEKLLRRVTLDLTGLPPTIAELDAFLQDDSPNAYEKAVNRLLASPRYGERMAWEWLDAARYADSNGYQGDRERTMWPWRDWVVDAINANMPFDQFTVWQIAGDLLPDATFEQKLATGFNRNHMINGEGGRIAEENRVEYIFDQIETVGAVWLGLTVNCCRCHDHKFDPLSQANYFELFDFYNRTPVNGGGGDPQTPPVIEAPGQWQRERMRALEGEIASIEKRLREREQRLAASRAAWETKKLETIGDDPWRILSPDAATAKHQKLTILYDRSILAGGDVNPKNDTYTITALPSTAAGQASNPVGQASRLSSANPITGLRLEALKHESLTKIGLSRADSANFVLTEIEISVKPVDDGEPRRIKISSAEATFEQGNHKITTAFDGDNGSGWAVWEGRVVDREHAAVFRFAGPIDVREGESLVVTLRHDSPHANHNLGRFRLSVTSDDKPVLTNDRAALRAALRTPRDKRTDEQRKLIAQRHHEQDEQHRKLTAQLGKNRKQLDDLRKSLPKVMIMADGNPRKTHILDKGLYNQPRDRVVTAGVPQILPPLPADAPRDRLALARWLVDESNPLAARVVVNRYWQSFFGAGLVTTPEDFGSQSKKPTHPQLLDFLATEFMRSGWDVKHMHRLIVTSATYRQSAKMSEALRQRDPANKLLARGPRYRLPSWMIRDQALAASGLLVEQRGGPPVKPYQPPGVWAEATFGNKRYQHDKGDALYRRSLYTFWRRIVGPTLFFDAAKRQTCEVNVTRTNSPLHALATLNDVTYVEAARAMAQRVMLADDDAAARVALAFRLATSRKPNDAERAVLLRRLELLKQQYGSQPDEAVKLLRVGESPRDEKLDATEHAAYAGVCLLIFNLDEVLTK